MFGGMREKKRILGGGGEGEGKTKLRGRRCFISVKNDLACLYLYLGYL